VILSGRVPEEVRDAARQAADDDGISLARYLELLVVEDARRRARHPRPARYTQEAMTA
jgi:hypothetical protein